MPAVVLVARTIRETGNDDATHMAAGVSFYAILSLFPMTLGLVAVLSFVLESTSTQAQLLAFFRDYMPGASDVLQTNIRAQDSVQGVMGAVSLVGLFWTASAVFGAVSRSVNRAWDVHRDRPFWLAKSRQMAMALGVGVLFLLSVGTTAALELVNNLDLPEAGPLGALETYGTNLLARLVPFAFTFAIFLFIYKYIPNTRTRWRYIWPGVLLAAVSFEVGKALFVLYVENFADYSRIYGSLGSVVALMVWIYLSALILIVGAEFASEYGRMREGVAQGKLIEHRDRDAAGDLQ